MTRPAMGALLLATVMGCASNRVAERSESVASEKARQVVLTLAPYAGTALRQAEVSVGGHPPVPFIFDTGAGFTLIVPSEVPEAGCAPFGQVTGFRADGEPISAPRCGPVSLALDGFRTERELMVFDLNALLHGAPPVAGLMGLDVFDGRAVTLDWSHDRVTVETPASFAERVRGMTRIPARIVREANGAVSVFLEAKAKVGTLWLELDTGNNGPAFLAPHALAQLGLDVPKGKTADVSLDLSGLGAVRVQAAPREMIYDGQLNPAFTRQLVLTVDLARDQVWARRTLSEPTAGVEGRSPPGPSRRTPGSPGTPTRAPAG